MKGIIFNVQRFCINDGPGIRTTVFMKGCPLRCVWCHNPESQLKNSEIMFYKDKCTGCGRCVNGIDENFVCYNDAKELCGREAAVDDVAEQALKDKVFFENSGGGVTLSGGEPLFQAEFARELLKELKRHGVHTAVETCGFAASEKLKSIAEFTDLFLYDCKETDGKRHKELTGVDNALILENLSLLESMKRPVILRCPIIKGINDRTEHFANIAELADKHENVMHIEVEPYHPLGEAKSVALGREENRFSVASEEEKNMYLSKIRAGTQKEVKFA